MSSSPIRAGVRAGLPLALVTSSMGFAEARQVMQQLGPGYEAVRPDHFIGLVKSAHGSGSTTAG